MWLEPKLVGYDEAHRLGVMAGWWAVSAEGTPVAGPYPTEEAAMVGIGKRGADQPAGRPNAEGPAPEERAWTSRDRAARSRT